MRYKGAILSLIIAIVFVGLLAMGMLFGGKLTDEIGGELRTAVTDSNIDNQTKALAVVDVLETDAKGYADNFAFWFLIAIVIGMLLSGLYLEFEPAVVGVLLLVSVLAVGMSMLVSNMYDSLASDTGIVGVAQEMTLSSSVFGTIFPTIIFVTFIVTLMLMYSRKNSGVSNGF